MKDKNLRLALALAADELLDAAIRFVVGHLDGRMLREKGGGGMQDAADAAIKREFAAADRVDRDPGGVRRIFDRKFQIDFHRHIAEKPAFDANESKSCCRAATARNRSGRCEYFRPPVARR